MNKKKRLRVALLFGGRSTEHEVSLTSAVSIINAIDHEKYDVIPVKISKEGQWQVLPEIKSLDSPTTLQTSKGSLVLVGDAGSKGLIHLDCKAKGLLKEPVDVVFPILHGTFGEDGTIQGLLSLADIPFVGPGVLGSALGMDKIMMKQMFFQNDLPATDFMWFLRKDWEKKPGIILKDIESEIGYPCFVKPANTGSSVGISKAHNENEIQTSIQLASQYDRKILVETAVDCRELECAILGNDDPKASVVGEIVPCNEFYDYEAKYLKDGSQTLIPAQIPESLVKQIQNISVRAFKALDCCGLARVDFLLERKTQRLFINEINTIPGFTPISMYPKLWEASGLSYPELIDRLIELAIERHEDLKKSKFRKE